MSECVSTVVREVIKKRERKEENQTRKGRGGDRETRVTGIDRKRDEGIMSRQAGSEKNRAEERQEGGDGARFVGEGPGGKAKEEQRPKDLSSALLGQQS